LIFQWKKQKNPRAEHPTFEERTIIIESRETVDKRNKQAQLRRGSEGGREGATQGNGGEVDEK
jgi:hypothetical protein